MIPKSVYVVQNPNGQLWGETASFDKNVCIRTWVDKATTFGAFDGFSRVSIHDCWSMWGLAERVGFKLIELTVAMPTKTEGTDKTAADALERTFLVWEELRTQCGTGTKPWHDMNDAIRDLLAARRDGER